MMELANQLGIKSGNLNKQHGWSVDPAECVLETSVWDQGSRTPNSDAVIAGREV